MIQRIIISIVLLLPCNLAYSYEFDKVAFVFSLDKQNKSEFYINAEKYYQQKNDYLVVNNLVSLEDIHNWLNTKPRTKPWKEIHIISHGTSQKGLSLRVMRDQQRSKSDIADFSDISSLMSLDSKVINSSTNLKLLACGVGRHSETIESLKQMFSNNLEQKPKVYASSGYHYFSARSDGIISSREVPYFHFLVSEDVEFSPIHIADKFEAEFPEVEVSWESALRSQAQLSSQAAFSIYEDIVLDVLAYKEDLEYFGSIELYAKAHPKIVAFLGRQNYLGKVKFNQTEHSAELDLISARFKSIKVLVPELAISFD